MAPALSTIVLATLLAAGKTATTTPPPLTHGAFEEEEQLVPKGGTIPDVQAEAGQEADGVLPNIVMILVDDLGFNNVGFRRAANAAASPDDPLLAQAAAEIHTPRVDALVADGILLDRHYGAPICSPSRCALQTGRLPVHVNAKNTGVLVNNPADPVSGYQGIPRNMTGVAQQLKRAGYATAMTGKWDAGMATPEHTPWGRGYDEFYGYYQHANNYWNKEGHIEATGAVDLCLNQLTDLVEHNATYRGGVLDPSALDDSCSSSWDEDPSCYEEHLFKKRALELLEKHDIATPLFYFHSFHLIHTPLNIPNSYLTKIDELASPYLFDDAGRRNYSAMVLYMDEVVGLIVDKLHDKGMWENTYLTLVSDNGGPLYVPGSANNYPLKGGKYSDWEGGVRTMALMAGGALPDGMRGTVHGGVVAISDWYGMFLQMAGIGPEQWADASAAAANAWLQEHNAALNDDEEPLPLLYGVESKAGMLQAILTGNETNGLHPTLQISAKSVLAWPYKFVSSIQPFSNHTGPLYPNCSGTLESDNYRPWQNDSYVLEHYFAWSNDEEEMMTHMWGYDCGSVGCLFNVRDDPEEWLDLSTDPDHADLLEELRATLAKMNEGLFVPDRGLDAPEACQAGVDHGGYFGPFIDADDYYTEPKHQYTPEEERRNEVYMGLIEQLAVPEHQETIMKIVRQVYPEYLREPLEQSFDECINQASA